MSKADRLPKLNFLPILMNRNNDARHIFPFLGLPTWSWLEIRHNSRASASSVMNGPSTWSILCDYIWLYMTICDYMDYMDYMILYDSICDYIWLYVTLSHASHSEYTFSIYDNNIFYMWLYGLYDSIWFYMWLYMTICDPFACFACFA